MAKQQSFADKATKKKKKDLSTYVKYIKSVKSEKTGYWRFNEQMIQVKEGENLDGALKRMDELNQVLDMEMPVVESAAEVEIVEKDGVNDPESHLQEADDNGMTESKDIIAEESVAEVNEPVEEDEQDEVEKTDVVAEPASKDQLEEESEPETDDQESGATEGDEANIEKENDVDEPAELATKDGDTVTEKKVEDADASGKDTSAKSDESA